MNTIPGYAQAKAWIQRQCGQADAANKTDRDFVTKSPVTSQVTSAVQLYSGDDNAAWDTQKKFGWYMLGLLDYVPVLGHIKGGIHYYNGDREGGSSAMKASTRTTAVVAAGALALPSGLLFAIPAAALSGVAADAAITGVDSVVNGEVRPYGSMEPLADPNDAGKWCDAACGMVVDGATGCASGSVAKSLQGTASLTTNAVKPMVVGAAESLTPYVSAAGSGMFGIWHIVNNKKYISMITSTFDYLKKHSAVEK